MSAKKSSVRKRQYPSCGKWWGFAKRTCECGQELHSGNGTKSKAIKGLMAEIEQLRKEISNIEEKKARIEVLEKMVAQFS